MFLVRLHVIQFTRYRRRSLQALARSELGYLITTLFVCQVLFSSFLKLFWSFPNYFLVVIAVLRARWPFIRQLLDVSTSGRICQELFSFFFKFLFDSLSFVPLSGNSHILPLYYPFVNGYFKHFSTFKYPFSTKCAKKLRGLFRGPCKYLIKLYSASSIRP